MNTGMQLNQFAAEVARQNAAKKDYKAPSTKLELAVLEQPVQSPEHFPMQLAMRLGDVGTYPIRKLAHQQIAERIKMPWNYYERCMSEAPELLTENANHWLHAAEEVRTVRLLDGQMRAYLGNKYRPLDNFDLFQAVAPTLLGDKAQKLGIRIESCQITETRFYIKAFSERITGAVKLNDIVQAGVVIQNSEVGHSAISVDPANYRLICYNGMIVPEAGMKRRHVGRGTEDDNAREIFTDKTLALEDGAFWSKVNDLIVASFDQLHFNKQVEKMQAALDNRIPAGGADLKEIVESTRKTNGLSESEGSLILNALIEGGDLSQFGLANAITRAAQSDTLNYDDATSLERLGGKVLELPPSEWKELVAA